MYDELEDEEQVDLNDPKNLVYTPVEGVFCKDGQHVWVPAGTDLQSNMKSEVCANCWIGRSISL